MKSRFLKPAVFILSAILLSPNCEEPEDITVITFMKTYGGSGGEIGYSVQQTTDGGYFIVGSTSSYGAGDLDVWLIKTDASGETVWTETFGSGDTERGFSGQQTSDGGYITTGQIRSLETGSSDVWLIKTDASGDRVWSRIFIRGSNWGMAVQQTSDGGYIIATGGLIKTDASGDTVWTRTFELLGCLSVQQTADGGYIATGETGLYLGAIPLIKSDAEGNEVWIKIVREDNDTEWANSVQQTYDGGYIVTGGSQTPLYSSLPELPPSVYYSGENAFLEFDGLLLFKTDTQGNEVWYKIFNVKGATDGRSVQQTSDGGYIIVGTAHNEAGGRDVLLFKTDAAGDSVWAKTLGGSQRDVGLSVQQTSDGGYIIAGYTHPLGAGDYNWDVLLIKTDEDGNVE